MQISLTINEACTATGIGRTKLYEMIGSGKLQAKKLGHRTLIMKADLENFLQNLESYAIKKEDAQ